MDSKNPQQLESLLQNLSTHLTGIMQVLEQLLSLEQDNEVAKVNLRTILEKLYADGKTLESTVDDLVDVFKRDFSAGLSHELRGPVTPIIGWTELLLLFELNNAVDKGFNLREILTIIHHCCTRLLHFGNKLKTEYLGNNNTITTSE